MSNLPFTVGCDLHVHRYTVSHKELLLRSNDFGAFESRIEICFEAVERMELDPRFTGGFTLTPVSRHGDLDDEAAVPLLLLHLAGGSFGSGFVACGKVTARRFRREGDDVVFDRVLFWEGAVHSVHGVGGRPAEPAEIAFGLPVLRRYAREKRTSARFPPPRNSEGSQSG
ncbi:hypothetical protein ACQP1G_13945 [Nocardia sp. CA-107356]|uniref:hypothetical protein n=1 Tax=Nocardia sp. CA-107356 TaxID=3239972 RepID=UPI003D8F027F